MATVIHKETVKVTGRQAIPIEGIVEILSFAVQRNRLVMYFVRDKFLKETREVDVCIHGTGYDIHLGETENMAFMGTHLMADGALVWHVWARIL